MCMYVWDNSDNYRAMSTGSQDKLWESFIHCKTAEVPEEISYEGVFEYLLKKAENYCCRKEKERVDMLVL